MAKKKTEKEQPKIKQAANFENAGLVMEQHKIRKHCRPDNEA